MATDRTDGAREHWSAVYRNRAEQEVSWFQRQPTMSMRLLVHAGLTADSSVIDVGGGASTLVDHLLERGVRDVTVLDVAAPALQAARYRLGDAAGPVTWLVRDLLDWRPDRRYTLWHDRAVFHFLTDPEDRARYAAILGQALQPGGHVVIATFAEDGPDRCSGLPVARYGPATLAAEFPDLSVSRAEREEHRTPSGIIQPFTWLVLESPG